MRAVLLATLLTGCFIKPDAPPAADDASVAGDAVVVAGGTRADITIELVPEFPIPDVPISVVIAMDSDLGTRALTSEHIAFVDKNSVALPCEIVAYTPGIGALEAWVRLPVVSETDRMFQLVFGTDIESPCDRRVMWAGYHGVWHFADAESTIARDSTVHDHHANVRDGEALKEPGRVGQALRLDDSSGPDMLCAVNTPALDPADRSFSFEVWVHPDANLGMWDSPMWKGGKSDALPGFDFELGTGQWVSYVRDYDPGTDNFLVLSNEADELDDEWSHLAVSVSREANVITTFLDGVMVGSQTPNQSTVMGGSDLCFGDVGSDSAMRGLVDEARVHGSARTPAWFELTYANIERRDEVVKIHPPR